MVVVTGFHAEYIDPSGGVVGAQGKHGWQQLPRLGSEHSGASVGMDDSRLIVAGGWNR